MKIDPDIAFLIAEHAVAAPYRQIEVMPTWKFLDWLFKREVRFSNWETLHWLWSAGVLMPVAVRPEAVSLTPEIRQEGRFIEAFNRQGSTWLADTGTNLGSIGYLPYGRGELDSKLRDSLYWHPFQFVQVRDCFRILETRFSVETLLCGPDNYADAARRISELLPKHIARWTNSDQFCNFPNLLALLLAVEPLVHPRVYGVFTSSSPSERAFESYLEWRQEFDSSKIVNQCRMDLTDVEHWHRELSIAAQLFDPIEHFRDLLQHSHRKDQARVEGVVLAAYELYDHAELLRRFVEGYWDLELWEEDDYRGGPSSRSFKQREYGTNRAADANREQFWRIARYYGLDPQVKATWFLEGDTEVSFFFELANLRSIELENVGLEIFNLSGKDGHEKDKSLRFLLQQLRKNGAFTFMALDREGTESSRHIDGMKRMAKQGLLTAGYMVWDPDFESANFSLTELVYTANSMLAHELNNQISTKEVEAQMLKHSEPVGKAIEAVLRKHRCYGGKGKDWGSALAKVAFLDPKNRPAISAFEMLLSGQWADFDATLEHFEADPDGHLIEK